MTATHTVLTGLAAVALVVIVLAVGITAVAHGYHTRNTTRRGVRWIR